MIDDPRDRHAVDHYIMSSTSYSLSGSINPLRENGVMHDDLRLNKIMCRGWEFKDKGIRGESVCNPHGLIWQARSGRLGNPWTLNDSIQLLSGGEGRIVGQDDDRAWPRRSIVLLERPARGGE